MVEVIEMVEAGASAAAEAVVVALNAVATTLKRRVVAVASVTEVVAVEGAEAVAVLVRCQPLTPHNL